MEPSANTVFWLRRGLDAIVERLEAIQQIADDYKNSINRAEHREREARQRDAEAIAEQIRLAHATETKRSAENKKNLCAQWVIGSGTWAAVVAASIYAWIAMNQLHTMREQTKASVVAFQTDERAWIGFKFMEGPITFTLGKSFLVPTQLINTGKTPAKDVHGNIVVGVFKKVESLDFTYSPGHAHYFVQAGTIFPNGTITESFEGIQHDIDKAEAIILTPSLRGELFSGESLLIVYGRMDYSDIFGVKHWTTYCRYVLHPERISDQCTRYNDTDSNQPN